jgi:hypothetical protein
MKLQWIPPLPMYNTTALQPRYPNISHKKSKKEFVKFCTSNTHDTYPDSLTIFIFGRIVSKEERYYKIRVAHWIKNIVQRDTHLHLSPCTGCPLSTHIDNNKCIMTCKLSELININEIVRRVPYNTQEIILANPKQHTNTWDNWTISSNELCLNKIIYTLDIESTYINQWITSAVLKKELFAHLAFNKSVTSQMFTIYMNRSYNQEDDILHTDNALIGAG